MRIRHRLFLVFSACVLALALCPCSGAQVNTVNLSGTVLDPQSLAVQGAKIMLKSVATGAERTATSNADGRYEVVGLPPGNYSLTVDAPGLATLTIPSLTLTLGVAAEYNPQLRLKTATEALTVSAAPELVETGKTDVSTTITESKINNLPINGRNYINFTLLNSQASRDSTPSIGAAPTSGLNFGGQRARSNEVSVDGADAVDNSVNGVRATVSQEAVQEFQVITSNYMPEYGRAMGGVVNIVTKSGSNNVHGDVFGFLRDSGVQARNPFSVTSQCNPATLTCGTTPVKQSYTRAEGGLTIGGPIQRDKTFYFFSYEITRRQETGFTNIGANNFDLEGIAYPAAAEACGISAGLVTKAQAGFLAVAPLAVGVPYFCAAAGSSATALFGNTALYPGAIFPSSGARVPASFIGLVTTIGNYPISEGTSLWSLKLDHNWNSKNSSFIRANVSPSTVNGIQVNAQNQTFGQNAGSRTSVQQTRDLSIVGQHTTSIRDNLFNEFRFQFARRGLHYGFSNLSGGSLPGVNIAGYAFFGREPFTTEDRTEKRYQWTDDVTWTKGAHLFKTGVDVNFIQLGSTKSQIFTLNYGGIYSFGSLSATSLGFPAAVGPLAVPGFNAVQAYGLGLPTIFFQGIGQSHRPFNNKTLGIFAQDSWKIGRHLTLNYGVRYDIEWLPTFPPSGSFNGPAESAFGVKEGIPVDSNNVAPRIGLAWDPWGDGKTVIRAGYGFFYDHPALALAFLSTAEDGALSALLEAAGGTPGGFNASSIFQGILGSPFTSCNTAVPSACYLPSEQRFNAFQPNSLFTNQNFLAAGFPMPLLPFTIPIRKNFQYALAQQSNLTVEREISKDWKISVGYNFTHGTHLDRAININTTNPALLISNDNNAVLSGLVSPGTNPLTVQVPLGATNSCVNTGTGSIFLVAPGILGTGFAAAGCAGSPIGFVGTPAVFNYFRPSGPNPSFAGLVPGGYATLTGLAGAAGFPTGFPGVQVPWSDVIPQTSSGNSNYQALSVTVTKRFSQHVEMLSGWTWSHAIDDSTDLSTLLAPQDNNNPNGERGNSNFDQRHRWVTSAVFQSAYHQQDSGFWKKFLADFTVAPVIEAASGRPYNVLIGYDSNLDFGSSTGRPSFVALHGAAAPAGSTTSAYIPGFAFTVPNRCVDSREQNFGPFPFVPSPPYGCVGTLGRNAFARPGFFQIDLRVSRTFSIGERLKLQVIADGFNMLNRFNVSDVNPVCDPTAGSPTCPAGQPTAAYDPRTFQFGLKVTF